MKKYLNYAFLVILCSFTFPKREKPTLYLIGDSTVAEGNGKDSLFGWGKFLPVFFDINKINIENYAVGGTSARTFQTNGVWNPQLMKKGMWDTVSQKMKKGDFLLIQFGLNDQSKVNDSSRSRGTLPGIGDDTLHIFNNLTHKIEIVHTFGWYLKKFADDAKAKGVTAIICSSIPKNEWKEGKLIRGEKGFANWAIEISEKEHIFSIDLNNLIADQYDATGQEKVTSLYHLKRDNTHTTEQGAMLNAQIVANTIKHIKGCLLKKYLL